MVAHKCASVHVALHGYTLKKAGIPDAVYTIVGSAQTEWAGKGPQVAFTVTRTCLNGRTKTPADKRSLANILIRCRPSTDKLQKREHCRLCECPVNPA